MPLTLRPPRKGHSPNWTIRGTYLRQYVNRSAGTSDKRVAQRILAKIREEIECNSYARPGAPTFASAALSYMQAGGERRYLEPLLHHFGNKPLCQITQAHIDAAAIAVLPNVSPATRNRQVYTPISAVLRHASVTIGLRRPKGAAGKSRMHWLTPDQAFALLAAAMDLNSRFGALCTFLLYTGVRLGEALRLEPPDLELSGAFAYIRQTKNREPRPVHLPPVAVAALAGLSLSGRKVFGFAKGGALYSLLIAAAAHAGVSIPERVAFHIFRHTYGAWMRRYCGLDTSGLVGTGAWKSRTAAAVYEHVEVREEARKADMLPTRAGSVPKRSESA